ncbi:MAG TPA: RagB/SusD family nutrient uptake outer membrane protein, partial [Sphingobacteriaceae bacterium]
MSGLVIAAMMSSCSDEFLNQEPSTAIPSDQALNTDADVLAAVNGMYSALQATDLYGRTKFVLGDLLADNSFVSVENAGRYITFEGYTHSRTSSEIAGLWTNAYVAIGRANEIINSSQAKVNDQATVDHYKGEAYAVRALMYFELVRHFARPFTDNPNGPGVPIVLERAITAKPGRNTVTEVYNQINSDLDKAYTMLSKYYGTGRFSKFAARGLAAKVALYQGNDATALQYAEEVINQGGFSLIPRQNVVSYWGSAATQTSTKNETLFEVTFTEIDNNGSDEIGDMYSQQGGYGDILTTEDVYNLY